MNAPALTESPASPETASTVPAYGAVIAAPPPETRELFCRSGLKYYARIPKARIMAALTEIRMQRAQLNRGKPANRSAVILLRELDLAARMAAQSCHFMLWQQALAAGRIQLAQRMARTGIIELRKLEQDFKACWPQRNKATTAKCSPFLQWRINDYRRGKLHFSPEQARGTKAKTSAAE